MLDSDPPLCECFPVQSHIAPARPTFAAPIARPTAFVAKEVRREGRFGGVCRAWLVKSWFVARKVRHEGWF